MIPLVLIAQLVVASADTNLGVPAQIIVFQTAGVEECCITPDLRVDGTKPKRCVEFLETKARLARAETRVNSAIARKKR